MYMYINHNTYIIYTYTYVIYTPKAIGLDEANIQSDFKTLIIQGAKQAPFRPTADKVGKLRSA